MGICLKRFTLTINCGNIVWDLSMNLIPFVSHRNEKSPASSSTAIFGPQGANENKNDMRLTQGESIAVMMPREMLVRWRNTSNIFSFIYPPPFFFFPPPPHPTKKSRKEKNKRPTCQTFKLFNIFTHFFVSIWCADHSELKSVQCLHI